MSFDPTRLAQLELQYRGSVKNVYRESLSPSNSSQKPERLFFEFTDDFSVFDWGKMPNSIPHKGSAIALISAALMKELEKNGVRTHLLQVEQDAMGETGLWVQSVLVERPKETVNAGCSVYDYSFLEWNKPGRLIPLEVVFRFEAVLGSSFVDRYRKKFGEESVQVGTKFKEPIIEYFTKLEKTDRPLVNPQEVLEVSRLSEANLEKVKERTVHVAKLLQQWFLELGITLLDGKLEWALDQNGDLILVDGIGPDELRLVIRTEGKSDSVSLSKELLREFYRSTPWFTEVQAAKQKGESVSRFLPPSLPNELIRRTQEIYIGLSETVLKKFPIPNVKPLMSSVAVIGAGGREHALAWKLLQSPLVKTIVLVPGNDGMNEHLKAEAIRMKNRSNDFKSVDVLSLSGPDFFGPNWTSVGVALRERQVDFCVVGPDQALSEGAVDAIHSCGILCFGPTQNAAKIESSKGFSKEVMSAAQVPTARYYWVKSLEEACRKIEELPWKTQNGLPQKWVLKADGLALGKGVVICANLEEGMQAAKKLFEISGSLVIEEFLEGFEISWLALCDGETAVLLDPAKDYKTLTDDPRSPNTGGMGTVSPVRELFGVSFTEDFKNAVKEKVFAPVLKEMKARGVAFRGILYAGLMIEKQDSPLPDGKIPRFWVLEFNARFGDPETQCLIPRMEDDLLPWLKASAQGLLHQLPKKLNFSENFCVYWVGASEGYPENPIRGKKISGLEQWIHSPHLEGFISGVKVTGDAASRSFLTSGGRVLGALGTGESASEARMRAFEKLSKINWEGKRFRQGIAQEWGTFQPRIAILASGRGSNAEAILTAVQNKIIHAHVAVLISNRSNAGVIDIAKRLGFPVQIIENEEEQIASLKALKVTDVVLAGYMKVLSPRFINEFREKGILGRLGESRIINIHPSLLPEFKGLNSYAKAFEAFKSNPAKKETGVTIHRVEPELDSGPILAQEKFNIEDCSTVAEVEERGLKVEHALYVKTLSQLWPRLRMES